MSDKKICVYVGANIGNSLYPVIGKYDEYYLFEPDPEIFSQLSSNFKRNNIFCYNLACGKKKEIRELYVMPNRVSTSLADIDEEHQKLCKFNAFKTIKVNCINLYDFLKERGIEHIDYYISDCQGSDCDVLETLKPMLDNKQIKEIYVETHGDTPLYKGLDNRFIRFKELLSNNYNFIHASLGSQGNKIVSESEIPEKEFEWDSLWRVK